MSDQLDPVKTSEQIKASYRRYLGSLLAAREPDIGRKLLRAIDESPALDKGPFLEATPPYVQGATPARLIREGVLSPAFAQLDSDALPMSRSLYAHQEAAIRKVRAGRNLVVATGTGSGKTESFLLPILDSLVRERERGTLGPGVRALLLYPMNALANDQMKRLRSLLKVYPDITFGRYTGDTEHDAPRARETFSALNPGQAALPNELLSRDEMRSAPPHLLLTNYAMLEYLLLRPQDMGLFPADGEHTWRFLVIDEAHVYDGTKGAEIAMLLRRLRDRVAPSRELQCIATSATVGSDAKAVTDFGTRLFGLPFEWVEDDPSRRDLITAELLPAPPGPFWGPLTAKDYRRLERSGDAEEEVLAAGRANGYVGAQDPAHALMQEQGLATLKSILRSGPLPFDTLVNQVFPDDPEARDGLVAMVALASRLRTADGSPALSARYHLFLRATEGAFSCLSASGPHVHLARHERCPDCDAGVFEIGACRRCGAVHLLGDVVPVAGTPTLKHRRADKSPSWLVLGASAEQIDDDEEVFGAVELTESDHVRLCVRCGVLNDADANNCSNQDCRSNELRQVGRLSKGGQELAGCLVCGARGEGTVRAFETGSDAAGAVIATALYQSLPASENTRELSRPGEGRKLLMFSDSRQAAAFFAPYLEDTYGRLQRRRLVFQGLVRSGAAENPAFPADVVFHTRACADAVRVFGRSSSQEQQRVVAPWVMAEATSMDDRQSLEGLGLLKISLDRDKAWAPPGPLLDLGFSEEEAWEFVAELVRTLRLQGAMTMPEVVPANHEIFAPRLGPIYARMEGPEARRKVLSWLPARGTNRRVDYAARCMRT